MKQIDLAEEGASNSSRRRLLFKSVVMIAAALCCTFALSAAALALPFSPEQNPSDSFDVQLPALLAADASVTSLDLDLESSDALQPTLYMGIEPGAVITIDWGDGTDSSSSTDGSVTESIWTITKDAPYAATGTYAVRLSSTYTGQYPAYVLGTGAVSVLGGDTSAYRSCLTGISCADNAGVQAYSFDGCTGLEEAELGNCNETAITSLRYVFQNCSQLAALDVSGWDTSAVTNLSYAFASCSSLETLDLSDWDVSKVTNTSYTFVGCSSLVDLDITGWELSALTNIKAMFMNCSSITALDLSGFDTSRCTDMSYLFYNCAKLPELDASCLNTYEVIDLSMMFYRCSSLTSLDFIGWDTYMVEDTSYMFYYCTGLQSIAFGAWDTENFMTYDSMFAGANNIRSITIGPHYMLDTTPTPSFTEPYTADGQWAQMNSDGSVDTSTRYAPDELGSAQRTRGTTYVATSSDTDLTLNRLLFGLLESVQYTGSPLTPITTNTYIEDIEYTIAFYADSNYRQPIDAADVVDVGSYDFLISGQGLFSGKTDLVGSFVVVAKDLDYTMFEVDTSDVTYTGSEIMPTVAGSDNGRALVEGTDYTVAYANNINAGDATITITGQGNYAGELTYGFTILKATPVVEKPTTVAAVYGDKLSAVNLPDGWAWVDPDAEVGSVGNHEYSAIYMPTDEQNYETVHAEVEVVVSAQTIEASMFTLEEGPFAYTGSAIKPAVTSITLSESDYSVDYSNNIEPGTGRIVITGQGNYTGSLTYEFQIIQYATEGEIEALKGDVSAAQALLDSAVVSIDGSDVDSADKWVTQAVHDALESAITAAQAVASTATPTASEVGGASAALQSAIATFEAAEQAGTKGAETNEPEPGTTTGPGPVVENPTGGNGGTSGNGSGSSRLKQTIKVKIKSGKKIKIKVKGAKTKLAFKANKKTKKALKIKVKGKKKVIVKSTKKTKSGKTYKIKVFAKASGKYARSNVQIVKIRIA